MSREDRGRPGGQRPQDESFLSRWSRRKAEARAQEQDDAPAEDRAAAAEVPAEPSEAPLELPDIESLTAESDFKVFMAKGVPQHLRNQALRKLWRLKPSLANLDGLVDYGGDYTRGTGPVGAAVRTAYQVGKGYLREEPKAPDQVAAEPAPPVTDETQAPEAEGAGETAAAPAAPDGPAAPELPAGPATPETPAERHADRPAPNADAARARPLPRRG